MGTKWVAKDAEMLQTSITYHKAEVVKDLLRVAQALRDEADNVVREVGRLDEPEHSPGYGLSSRVDAIVNAITWMVPNLGLSGIQRRVGEIEKMTGILVQLQPDTDGLQPIGAE